MANVTFSRREFESEIKITKEIEEKINLLGTPLESISEKEIEIEVFPNRPDIYTLQGYLRAFKAFIGKDKGLKKYLVNKPEKNYYVNVDKSVKDVRPFTACAIVKSVSLDDERIKELMNAQEKLATTMGRNRKKMGIGIYPLDKISLPITYTANESKDINYKALGMPQESSAEEILLLHPTGRKYAHLLQNSKKYPVFIDSSKKILSMPPIINSEETGRITPETKDVFIECTGTDKKAVDRALIIIATTLADMNGKIYQMEIRDKEKYNTPDLSSQKIKISIENTKKLIGIEVTEKQIEDLLSRMGHSYKNGTVEIGAWRSDIMHEVDLIEDVAIAYGYNNLIPSIPTISTIGEESRESILKRKVSQIFADIGFNEISTYHLVKKEELDLYGIKDSIELTDSKTEYKSLRPNLLIPMLRILAENKDVEYPQRVCEIGKVFAKNIQKESGIEETEKLIIGISPSNVTEIKQQIDYLFRKLNLEYSIKESTHYNLIEGRTASVILNNKTIGYFGEVHPNCLKKAGMKMPLSIAEISLEEIYKTIS